MTAHSSDARESGVEQADESSTRARRAAATVARVNENGWLSVLLGGGLLAMGARSYRRSGSRKRGLLQGLAGAALIAVGLRQRRSGADASDDETSDGETSDEAAAHREGSRVLEQDETNPRGTSGEPDVERENDAGNVEFTDDQDLESGRQPGMEDEPGTEDPRSTSGDDAEIDLSEASMSDEVSEATGPSSTQAQPAQTDDVEPERTSEADPGVDGASADEDADGDGDGETAETGSREMDGSGDEPNPDADPGEATADAAAAEPAEAAEEAIEGEIDDEDREGVETEGGATIHTDTNESDEMDIDVDDVTDPGDGSETEAAGSDEQSDSHLDENPPDEDDSGDDR